jgi:Na+-translocating ferredoxin:NAD+ oxidoreductase subunit B
MSLVEEIDALLPQTQCGECGYPGCLPYAQAIATHQAPINRCPPGGTATIEALAKHLQQDPRPWIEDTSFQSRSPTLARIREEECIGCTKCIQACPVDAILGTASAMHTIIESECTGCGLCIEPCPVDCIEMHPIESLSFNKDKARLRFNAKKIRALRALEKQAHLYREKSKLLKKEQYEEEKKAKQAYILAALERAQAKKNGLKDK